jgi:hypothetical protein
MTTAHRRWPEAWRGRGAASGQAPVLVAIHAVAEADGQLAMKTVCGRWAIVDEVETTGTFGPDPVLNGCTECGRRTGVETFTV